MATLKTLINHHDIKQAYHHHQENNFTSSKQETIYAFWANDVERDEDGKFIEHHGKKVALDYQQQYDNVYLMENFEGKNKVLILDDYEKRQDVPLIAISAVCALASASYAKSASNIILTSVKGANINSFFRTNELPFIMNNQNITQVINVSRDVPKGKIYDKKEAYHVLRDEWLDGAIKEFNKTNKAYSNKEVCKEIYDSALINMAAEINLSQKALIKKLHVLNIPLEYQNYDNQDRQRELKRLSKCISLMQKNPELKVQLGKLQSECTNMLNDGILSHFNNELKVSNSNLKRSEISSGKPNSRQH